MIFTVFDLEIKKAIPASDGEILSGIEYCGGWRDFEGMGVSCWALCFLNTEDWSISEPISGTALTSFGQLAHEGDRILAHEIMTMQMANDRSLMGGFNSRKFDDKLLTANGINMESDFDILDLVLEAAGMTGIKYWDMQPKRKYNLASIATANGYEKTLSGEQAPIEWQRGNHQLVIDYCCNDVMIEAETLKRLLQGTLIDPNTGDRLKGHMEWQRF